MSTYNVPREGTALDARARPVRPVTALSRYQHFDFIVWDEHHTYWREDTDTVGTNPADLLTVPRAIIIVENSAQWADSTAHLRNTHPAFDYHIGQGERICYADADDDSDIEPIVFEHESCIGWGLSRKRLKALGLIGANDGRYPWHQVMDPHNFYGAGMTDIYGFDETIQWAREYRQWCKSRRIRITSSRGSAAAKVLRTLVATPQHKVPRTTNERVRTFLPSGHIRAFTHLHEQVARAVEYDQSGAYHTCAKSVPFPDRDEFIARGDFHDMQTVWWEPGEDEWNTLLFGGQHGVLLCEVEQWNEGQYRKQHPLSPWMPWTGLPIALATNELALAKRCDIRPTGIIAAWTSPNRNHELRVHAKISQAEIAAATDFQLGWLKPLNLAVYGMTAALPHPIRGRTLDGQRKDGPAFECMTNHVAWLAMLQAEVRKRSIMLALDLNLIGVRVIAIYADAVWIEPYNIEMDHMVPPYFRKKHHRNVGARDNHIVADGLVKAPGLSLDDPAREATARAYVFGA